VTQLRGKVLRLEAGAVLNIEGDSKLASSEFHLLCLSGEIKSFSRKKKKQSNSNTATRNLPTNGTF